MRPVILARGPSRKEYKSVVYILQRMPRRVILGLRKSRQMIATASGNSEGVRVI